MMVFSLNNNNINNKDSNNNNNIAPFPLFHMLFCCYNKDFVVTYRTKAWGSSVCVVRLQTRNQSIKSYHNNNFQL